MLGCSTTGGGAAAGARADSASSVWVAQTYSGGRQCEPREDYSAPDTRSVLAEAGVTVYETAERPDAVCMACHCPAYAATHYARIPSSDADRAERTGFERAAPPDDGSETGAASAAVTGRVFYLQRIALSPNAIVHVRLADVSRADAPSTTLAEQTIPADGRQVPIPFTLAYDPGQIDPTHRYAVRAEIRDGTGALHWTTDTSIPVLTQSAPSDSVEVRVVPASSVPPETDAPEAGGMAPLPTGRTLVYTCDTSDGGAFTFSVRPGPGEVGIELPERFGDRALVLPQVRAASGSKFEGDGLLFWVSGEHVRLDVDGQTFTCAERPPREGEGPDEGVGFRAVGQEPFWTLEIVPEQHLHFTYALGEQEVYTPVPEPEVAGGRTMYHAVTEAHDLRVVIEDAPCSDVMSGEAYEATVTVTLDGETYQGCGRQR